MDWYAAEPLAEVNPKRRLDLASGGKIPVVLAFMAQRLAKMGTPEALGRRRGRIGTHRRRQAATHVVGSARGGLEGTTPRRDARRMAGRVRVAREQPAGRRQRAGDGLGPEVWRSDGAGEAARHAGRQETGPGRTQSRAGGLARRPRSGAGRHAARARRRAGAARPGFARIGILRRQANAGRHSGRVSAVDAGGKTRCVEHARFARRVCPGAAGRRGREPDRVHGSFGRSHSPASQSQERVSRQTHHRSVGHRPRFEFREGQADRRLHEARQTKGPAPRRFVGPGRLHEDVPPSATRCSAPAERSAPS